jgi:hypothetical protein
MSTAVKRRISERSSCLRSGVGRGDGDIRHAARGEICVVEQHGVRGAWFRKPMRKRPPVVCRALFGAGGHMLVTGVAGYGDCTGA